MGKIPGWVDKKYCKECFARKNAEERCRGPKSWAVSSDGTITEDLKSAGADWQYYPEHPVPSDYGKCNKCKSFDPPCYSVKKCQQNVMKRYNNPYVQPWKPPSCIPSKSQHSAQPMVSTARMSAERENHTRIPVKKHATATFSSPVVPGSKNVKSRLHGPFIQFTTTLQNSYNYDYVVTFIQV